MCDDECPQFLYIESNGYAYHICVLNEDEKCPNADPCGLEVNKVQHERLAKENEKEDPNRTALREMDNPFAQEQP